VEPGYFSRHIDGLLVGLPTFDSRQRKSFPSELRRAQVTSGVHPAYEVGNGDFSKEVIRPGRKADNSFPSRTVELYIHSPTRHGVVANRRSTGMGLRLSLRLF
jgi:hypothetical protein